VIIPKPLSKVRSFKAKSEEGNNVGNRRFDFQRGRKGVKENLTRQTSFG
jgi:hypothetical protein